MKYTPYIDYLGAPLYLNEEFRIGEKNFKKELLGLLSEHEIDLAGVVKS